MLKFYNITCYIASSVSRHDEPNPVGSTKIPHNNYFLTNDYNVCTVSTQKISSMLTSQ